MAGLLAAAAGMLVEARAAPEGAARPEVTPETTLADCESWARREPRDLRAYDCFGHVARRLRLLDDAARRLDALLLLEPDNHWARFGLALIEWDRHAPRAQGLAIAAADGFAAAGDRAAEARARMSISISFQTVNEARALRELERADALAAELGDPYLRAYVAINRAHAAQRRQDYGAALQAYDDAETLIDPQGDPEKMRRSETILGMILSGRGAIAWRTGRLREALEDYQREAALYQRTGRTFEAAGVLYNIALTSGDLHQSEGTPDAAEVRARYDAALQAARTTGNRASEALLLVLTAQMLPPAEAAAEARRARELLRATPWAVNALVADWILAEALDRGGGAPTDEPMRLREATLRRAQERGDWLEIASGWDYLGRGHWRRGREAEAFAAWENAGDAYEQLRMSQPEAETRMRAFGRAIGHFCRLADRSLARWVARGDPADLERGFRAIERSHARSLLDAMDAIGAGVAADLPERAERDQVLQAIAVTQTRLADPDLDAAGRRVALDDLESLERREALLRDRIARADPEWGALRDSDLPGLDEVRAALVEGEMLLLYQTGDPAPTGSLLDSEAGGSWAVAIEPGVVRARPLPPGSDLARRTQLLLGAIARADGSDAALARLVGATLLEGLLPAEGTGLRRLIVAPDGALHRMPFEALRPFADGAALGERVEVTRVPSAAAFLRLRQGARPSDAAAPGTAAQGSAEHGRLALVVADPDLGGGAGAADLRLVVPWYEGLRAGRLPYARREGERVGRLFGAGGRLLAGEAATEAAVKRALGGGVRFLHVAAHAVVDELRPRRSAIVLAPGDAGEDGLLQPHEIGAVDLAGATVVLSACSSASGAIERGEGVNGLSAAFLRAGAQAVVGGLWALRDADTAAFVETMTAAFGRGETVAASLRAARGVLIRRGAPTSAWAGLVLIGDGDARPLPRGGPAGARREGAPAPAEEPGSAAGPATASGLRGIGLFLAALGLVLLGRRRAAGGG